MASSSSSSSSSSVANTEKKYDVFLNFRGADIRYGFISHLHGALLREKIETFFDEEESQEGNEVKSSLLDAIKMSTISVVTFSKDYASSAWCLEELWHILERKRSYGQTVLPVFYHVDPTDVENQTGIYEDALRKLKVCYRENAEKAQIWRQNKPRWKAAMAEAAKICGFSTNEIRNEAALVDKIIKRILLILNRMSPRDNEDLVVGVQSSITEIESLLHNASEENLGIVGIWGMGGIGKTTIAKVVFERIRNGFYNSFFIENGGKDSVNPFTKQKLNEKKVLIVLDNVTSVEEITALIGDFTSCLGLGSRIIITTRDKQLLKRYDVPTKNIYEVKGLSHAEALQLFSWYAFKKNEQIPSGFRDPSNKIVEYTKGVPLALKELGNFFLYKCEQRVEVWESEIEKLQVYPPEEIEEELKRSYVELRFVQRNIFLDIAFFFNWENKDFVTNFLVAHDFQTISDFNVLIDKCLISITSEGKISVNDLLQAVAQKIVRDKSKYPEERSHLSYHKDIDKILRSKKGTEKVEGISLDMSKIKEITRGGFGKMHKLRLFKLYNPPNKENINKVLVSRDLDITFTELRYLCWHVCPLKSLPLNFETENLVALEMPHGNLEQLWTDVQNLENLKYIDLSHSKDLEQIPDFSLFPNLVSLSLGGNNFESIPLAIRGLSKLLHLELCNCEKLRSLPELPSSLESIDAHGCTLLEPSSGLSILCPTKKSVRVNFSNCFKLNQNALEGFIKVFPEKTEPPLVKRFCSRKGACICFPGSDIPDCFADQSTGSSITFKIPQVLSNKKFLSFSVSAVVEFRNYYNKGQGLEVFYECRVDTVIVYNGTLRSWECGTGTRFINSDHVFLGYDILEYDAKTCNNNGEMTLQFYVKDLNGRHLDAYEVKKCGFRSLHYQEEVTVDHGEEQDEPEPPCKRLKHSNQLQGESSLSETERGERERETEKESRKRLDLIRDIVEAQLGPEEIRKSTLLPLQTQP